MLTLTSYAAHDTTVTFSIVPSTIWEGVNNNYGMDVKNGILNSTINNVTLYNSGFSTPLFFK